MSNTASLLPYLFTLSYHLLKKYFNVNKLFLSSQFSIKCFINLIVLKKLTPSINWSFAAWVNFFLNASAITLILNALFNLLLTVYIKLLLIYISYFAAKSFQFCLAIAVLYLSSIHLAIFCLVASPPLSFAFLCHCKSFILNKFWLASSPINKYLPSVLNILKRIAFQSSYILLSLFKKSFVLPIGTALFTRAVTDASAKALEWLTSCLLVNCFKALSNTASLLPYLFTLSNHLLKKYLRVNKLFLFSQFSINDLMNLIVFKKLQPVMNWSFATLVNLFLNASFIAFILNPFLNLLLTKNIKLLLIYISYLSANFFQFSLALAILYLSSSHFAIFCLFASIVASFAFSAHCNSFILNKYLLFPSWDLIHLPSTFIILNLILL